MYIMRNGKYISGLIDLIDYINDKIEIKTMVEIGCYSGESTLLFSQGFNCLIYAVDPWQNGYDNTDIASYCYPMSGIEKIFDKRLANRNIIKMKMTSEEASREIDQVDLVYIDGNHNYENIKRDLEIWHPKTKILAGHDYSSCGVNKALKNYKIEKTFIDDSFILGG